MKKGLIFVISFLLFTRTLYACWIYSSPEERITRADLIVLVELLEEKGAIDRGEWNIGRDGRETYMRQDTVWEVKIHKTIKGTVHGELLEVVTSGRRGNKGILSTDFYLDDYVNQYALLFLNEKEDGYYIQEPADIVPLKNIIKGDLAKTLQQENLLTTVSMEKDDQEEWEIYTKLLLDLKEKKQEEITNLLKELTTFFERNSRLFITKLMSNRRI